ncbi:MAG: DUF4340 domain-containing protein [Candidatus Hydrogenedentes bacterium]|nr:DUF4340 domain-containing protein [Candidatus Hydrogenedentota bacterium]
MKWRGTISLLVVFVSLLIFYWFLGWFEAERRTWQEESKKLFSFSPESIRELHISQSGGPLCVAKKDVDGIWKFEKPSKDIPAFSYMWDRVSKNLAELKIQRKISSKVVEYKSYGLDVPSLIVKALVDGYEKPIEVRFGFIDPTNTFRYATIDNETIFLVDEKQFFELNRSLEDLRHRFLVRSRETPLVRIEFAKIWTGDDEAREGEYTPQIGEESVVVVMERENENSPWYLLSPSKGLANQEAVNALASEIQFGVGRNFIDSPENLSDYGLDVPWCRLTYYDAKERAPQTLFLGGLQTAGQSTQEKDKEKRKRLNLSESTGVFAKLAGQNSVFLLDTHIIELLPKSPESFRDRRIFTRDVASLARMERIKGGKKVFSLLKERDVGWTLEYPLLPQLEVDQFSISNYISRLKTLEVQSLPGGTLEERGLDKSDDILKFVWENGDVAELKYVNIPGDNVHSYVTRDTSEIGIVTNDIVSLLWVEPEEFISLVLYKFSPAEVDGVIIAVGGTRYEFSNIEGNWRVSFPQGYVLLNQNDFLRVLRHLSSLTAVKAFNAEGEEKFGEVAFEIEIKKVNSESDLKRFKLGKLYIGSIDEKDPRYRWAKMEGRSGIFQIKQEIVDLITDMFKSVVKQN